MESYMSWMRLAGLMIWSAAFVTLMLFLFGVHMLGDCVPLPQGASCWADKKAAPYYFLFTGIAIYRPVTWLVFFGWRR